MTVFAPAYRATVFKPQSAQTDFLNEVEVLTPVAGAAHADEFKVSTVTVSDAWKPYLALPRGRRSRIDFVSKKVDVGSMTLTLLDKRVGSDNAVRWVTAFYGDEGAKTALLKCRVKVEESLDGGFTWHPYFTGRIEDAKQKGKTEFVLSLKDLTEDLNQDVFVRNPIPLGSSEGALGPIFRGRMHPYSIHLGFGPLEDPGFDQTPCEVDTFSGEFHHRLYRRGDNDDALRVIFTQELRDLASGQRAIFRPGGRRRVQFTYEPGVLRVTFNPDGGGGPLYYWLSGIQGLHNVDGHFVPEWWSIERAPDLLDDALPADNTEGFFSITKHGPLSVASPLFVDDVHPVSLLGRLFDGYFGILNDDGTPRYPIARNLASFTALLGDNTFPKWRGIIDKSEKLRTFASERVCKPCQLGYFVNAAGEVQLVDMRRQVAALAADSITDADLVDDPESATSRQAAGDAITVIQTKTLEYALLDVVEDIAHSPDLYPSVPRSGVAVTEVLADYYALGDTRTLDFGRKTHDLDLTSIAIPRANGEDEADQGAIDEDAATQHGYVSTLVEDLFAMFSHGATTHYLVCRRTDAVEAVTVGSRRLLECSALADPITNQRGGARLGLCIERSEDGPRVTLGFADLGANEVADPPSAFTIAAGVPCETVIDATITLNAAGSQVQFQILAQEIGGPAPAADDPRWRHHAFSLVGGIVPLVGLPDCLDVYVRARSYPKAEGGLKLPSAWVYPAPLLVATCCFVEPTVSPADCALSNVTASTATVTWTNPVDSESIFVFVDGVLVATLDPGTTSYDLTGLTPGATIVVTYDAEGAPGCAVTFEAPLTDTVAVYCLGGSIRVGLTASNNDRNIEIRRASDGAGTGETLLTAPGGLAAGTLFYDDPRTIGETWYYSARLIAEGFSPGPWGAWHPCTGVADPPEEPGCTLPVVTDVKSSTGLVGTVSTTIESDPEVRVLGIAYKATPGAGPEGTFVDDTEPYSADVAITPGATSTIVRRLTQVGCDGEVELVDTVFEFSDLPTPEPTPGVGAITEELGFVTEWRGWVDGELPADPIDFGPERQDHFDFGPYASGRITATVDPTVSNVPVGGRLAFKYLNENGEWVDLGADGGPRLEVDPASVALWPDGVMDGLGFLLADEARRRVRFGLFFEGGAATGRLLAGRVALQLDGGPEDPSTEPEEDPPGEPCTPLITVGAGVDSGDTVAFTTEDPPVEGEWRVTDTHDGTLGLWNYVEDDETAIFGTGAPLTDENISIRFHTSGLSFVPIGTISKAHRLFGGYDPGEEVDIHLVTSSAGHGGTWNDQEEVIPAVADGSGRVLVELIYTVPYDGILLGAQRWWRSAFITTRGVACGEEPIPENPGPPDLPPPLPPDYPNPEPPPSTGGAPFSIAPNNEGGSPVLPEPGDWPFNPFNGQLYKCHKVSSTLTELGIAQAAGMRMFVIFAGTQGQYRPHGVFNLALWIQQVRRFAGNATIAAMIADGTIFAHYLIDEPQLVKRWGKKIPIEDLRIMAAVSRELWPTLRTFIRTDPVFYDARVAGLTGWWAQWHSRKGEIKQYLDGVALRNERLGCTELAASLNVISLDGTGPFISGQFPDRRCASAADIDRYGPIMARHQAITGLNHWRFDSVWWALPGIPAAMARMEAEFQAFH